MAFDEATCSPAHRFTRTPQLPLVAVSLDGATQVIMRKFNAERANDLIAEYGITHAMLVPVQYQRMWTADNHSPDKWASVQWLFSTSAPLSAAMKEKILRDTDAQLLEFYGLTEGGVATTLVARKAAELGKLGSVGQVQPGGELRILGEDGELLGPNEPGEIVGRTGIMSDGYLNREEATKAMHWFDEAGDCSIDPVMWAISMKTVGFS